MSKRKAHYGGKSRGLGAGRSQVVTGERKRSPRLRPIESAKPRKALPRWLRVLLFVLAGFYIGVLGAALAGALK